MGKERQIEKRYFRRHCGEKVLKREKILKIIIGFRKGNRGKKIRKNDILKRKTPLQLYLFLKIDSFPGNPNILYFAL